MEIKCGIDMIEVTRIQESIEQLGMKFLKRVFTDNEIEYCESKKTMRYESYAARFAAKEAVIKAISTDVENKYEIAFNEIEILKENNGRPSVNIMGKALDIIKKNKVISIDVSLAHLKEYAIASVNLICDKK